MELIKDTIQLNPDKGDESWSYILV
jgi:hypothetical protein